MSLKARAYAKVNPFLDVTGKRPDGYHNIDTVMQTVSIYDEISVELTDKGISVACNCDDISGEDNIVYLACKNFLLKSGLNFGVKVSVIKNIPIAAGLGGGSSDAAAVLRLLNQLSGCALDDNTLHSIAAGLGADVPFFLNGGTARATGIGDILTKVASPKLYYVLLKEGSKQSTGAMYAKLDTAESREEKNADKFIEALSQNNISLICENIYNKFELCWDMEKMSLPLLPFSPLKVFLSGSGPTVCALFENETDARRCAGSLISDGYAAYYAETTDCGIMLV